MSEERACGLRDVIVLRADAREPYSRDVSMLNEARRGEHVEYTVIHSQSALPSDALMPSCVLWKRPQEAACSSGSQASALRRITFDFSPIPFLGASVAWSLEDQANILSSSTPRSCLYRERASAGSGVLIDQHSHHIRLFPFLGVHVACGLLKIKLT